jgi:hypothetical protein
MRSFLKISLVAFAVFICQCISAQEVSVDTTVVYNDVEGIVAPPVKETSDESTDENAKGHKYERRYMDEQKLQTLRSKKAFKYPDLENDTLKLKKELPPQQTTHFEGIDASVFLWLLVAVVVIIVVLQLSGVNMRQLFSPAKTNKRATTEEISQNIHEIPFEKAIADAINDGNYSLATRLMYLQSLKLLSDKGLIAWHENKTNWQYVYELKNIGLRSSFRTVTSIFEYVQYGDMKVRKEKFTHVQEAFNNFKMHVI